MTEDRVRMGDNTSPLKKKKEVKMGEKTPLKKKKEEQKLKRKKKQLMKKKIIIRNLSFKVSKDELRKIFSAFGEVLNVEIPETKEGKKRGFAFIQFKNTSSQVKAMKELNFKKIHGRPISIDFCVDKTTYQTKTVKKNSSEMSSNLNDVSDNDEDNDSEDDSKLNSTSEPHDESDDDSADEENDDKKVKDFLKEFDGDEEREDIDNASDETDDDTESSKSEDDMDDNSSMKSEQYKKKHTEDVSQGKTVFIRNISFKNTEEDLQSLVEEYGAVDYCLFCMDRFTDQLKGSAFVKFKEKEGVDKLVQESYKTPWMSSSASLKLQWKGCLLSCCFFGSFGSVQSVDMAAKAPYSTNDSFLLPWIKKDLKQKQFDTFPAVQAGSTKSLNNVAQRLLGSL